MSGNVDVLVVDDDASVRDALVQTLELADLNVLCAGSFVAAKDQITPDFPGVILSDIRMPGRDGFHLLGYVRDRDAELPVVLLTGEGDIPMAVSAMGQGAFDFLEKPCARDDLIPVLNRALANRRLVLENRRLKLQLQIGDPAERLIFGSSEPATGLRDRVRAVASMGTEVLVTGPPGAGISKVAEVIHLMSPVARGPFVKRMAAGLEPQALEESLVSANSGSIFFDEISTLPGASQFTLLERLEAGSPARVLAGSTSNLEADVASGRLNADLYYRLDITPVRIPAISERPEDIPELFRHYVAQAAEQAGLPVPDVSHDHTALLMAQDWPGNARSLMSAAMRFVLGMPDTAEDVAEMGLAEQIARVERALLIAALGRQNGRASAAAKALKLPRKTFYDKLARHGLKPEDYRRGS